MKNTMYTKMIANIGVYQKHLAKINGLPKSTDSQFEGTPKIRLLPLIWYTQNECIPKKSV